MPHIVRLPKSGNKLGAQYMYQTKYFPREFKVCLQWNSIFLFSILNWSGHTNLCKIKTISDITYSWPIVVQMMQLLINWNITCTLDELEEGFFWYPLSIPNSPKKFEDFGGATCPNAWLSSELLPAEGIFSTYSNREVWDLLLAVVLSITVGRAGAGSSGFCS
jgi:hypothetical protein